MKYMRNYLNDIEIVGATMCYKEGEQCRWSIDWLIENCDRVLVLLDNWDEKTENIVLDYKNRFPEKVFVKYSNEAPGSRDLIHGQVKRRFKLRQNFIREQAIKGLRELHDKKPIDLLIWPDSDEVFINQFPSILENFWYNKKEYDFMMLGFLEIYDSFRILISQKMAPHGRVFHYNPEMSAHPYQPRTVYFPFNLKRPLKVRNVVIHLNHFTEEYRKRRQFFDNVDMMTECVRYVWFLPKDLREMTVDEIAEYQFGHRQAPPKYAPILLEEYLNNKEYYNNKYNI